MKIETIHISGFKNLEDQVLNLGNAFNGFWGENGMGKSNLLEALFVLAKGKSFRPYSNRSDWHPESGKNLLIEARFRDSINLEYDLQLKTTSTGRVHWSLNGKSVPVSIIAEKIPLVVFSPDDHSLIRGGPELRRDYLDLLLTDVCPGYAEVLARFEKSLKSRNKLLKLLQKSERFEFSTELETWTKSLAKEAVSLWSLRKELWPKFNQYFQKVTEPLFEGLASKLKILYEHEIFLNESPQVKDLENKYYQIVKDNFQIDFATGWTHKGPHRDDFKIEFSGLDARAKASQGQARLMALSLRWCHALWVAQERQEIPLFLIDDFSNELDTLRRKKLLDLLGQISGQILVTGTDSSTISEAVKHADFGEYSAYEVVCGKILKI